MGDKRTEIQLQWAGRKFRCNKTGDEITIPKDVRECQFFSFGECFIDVGRAGCYSRKGGNPEEIFDHD
jgi:hypothetical protein